MTIHSFDKKKRFDRQTVKRFSRELLFETLKNQTCVRAAEAETV
jgi:hypothetical protein